MTNLCSRSSFISPVMFAALLMSVNVSLAHAGTIKQVRVAQYGHNSANTITSPIFDSGGVVPLVVGKLTASYDPKANIVRGLGSLFTKGPSLGLDKKVNLADILADSLRAEAKAMGYPLATSSAAGEKWDLTGDLKDIYLESWQITGWGAILFYGFIDVALQIHGPNGVAESRRFRIHSFYQEPGAQVISRTGKSEAALATLLVEGAQELLVRLNREFVRAKNSADIDNRVARLAKSGVKGHEADFHIAGLSGSANAVAALIALLPTKQSSDERSIIIDALARAGSPDALATLTQRYDKEDEQGRWYTLKAMDYIGGDAAMAFIKEKGPKDKEYSIKALAARVMAGK
jgi:hypothetical protein